jgi:hypothetical protein
MRVLGRGDSSRLGLWGSAADLVRSAASLVGSAAGTQAGIDGAGGWLWSWIP